MNKLTEIKQLKKLLIKYLPDFDPKTDCFEKYMETVSDEVRQLLTDEERALVALANEGNPGKPEGIIPAGGAPGNNPSCPPII